MSFCLCTHIFKQLRTKSIGYPYSCHSGDARSHSDICSRSKAHMSLKLTKRVTGFFGKSHIGTVTFVTMCNVSISCDMLENWEFKKCLYKQLLWIITFAKDFNVSVVFRNTKMLLKQKGNELTQDSQWIPLKNSPLTASSFRELHGPGLKKVNYWRICNLFQTNLERTWEVRHNDSQTLKRNAVQLHVSRL